MVLIAQNKPEPALQAFQSAIKIQPKQFEAYRGMGQAYDMMGQALDKSGSSGAKALFDQAVASYQRALALHNDDVVVLNNLAWLLCERSNKCNDALPRAQKARDLAPQDPKVLDTLGWIQYKLGAFGEAEKTLQPAVEKARDDALIHYHLGMARTKGAKKCEAVPTLRRAVMLDPKMAPTIDPVVRDLGC
jgi:tetratricopeptide (TPR) repeat protein